ARRARPIRPARPTPRRPSRCSCLRDPSGDSPSMVVTLLPAASASGVMHERMARPLSSTVHAPHTPTPQPYFVPSRPRRSPNTHSSGMRPSASTSRPTPLTISENVGIGALDVRYDDLDAILAAEDP